MGEVVGAQAANTAANNLTSSPAAIATTLFSSVGGILILGAGAYFLVEHVAGDAESYFHLWWNWLSDIPGTICREVLPNFISKHVCPEPDDGTQISGSVDPSDCSVTSVVVNTRTGAAVTEGPFPATVVMNSWNHSQIDGVYGPGVAAALKTCVEGKGGVFYEKRQTPQDPDYQTYAKALMNIHSAVLTACTPPVCPLGSMPQMTPATLHQMCVTSQIRPNDEQTFLAELNDYIAQSQALAAGRPPSLQKSAGLSNTREWFLAWRDFSVKFGRLQPSALVVALADECSSMVGNIPGSWVSILVPIFTSWGQKAGNGDFSFSSDQFPSLPYKTCTVQPGDTLASIGAYLGIPWQNIAALNNIPPPYTIGVGQVLVTSVG